MPTVRKWSKKVTQTSNALDLEPDVFNLKDPKKIAQSLKKSADRTTDVKEPPTNQQ